MGGSVKQGIYLPATPSFTIHGLSVSLRSACTGAPIVQHRRVIFIVNCSLWIRPTPQHGLRSEIEQDGRLRLEETRVVIRLTDAVRRLVRNTALPRGIVRINLEFIRSHDAARK